jgi:phosphatidate cytidylyltransferase
LLVSHSIRSLLGHFYIIALIMVIQVQIFREVISVADVDVSAAREKKLPMFRFLNWYFLLATNYFLYGESMIYHYSKYLIVQKWIHTLATHHRFISFSLYCAGFILFILSLKKGMIDEFNGK